MHCCAWKVFLENDDWMTSFRIRMSVNGNSVPSVRSVRNTARPRPTIHELNHANINRTEDRVNSKSSCAGLTKTDSALWADTRRSTNSSSSAHDSRPPKLPSPPFSPFCMLTSSHVGRSVQIHFRSGCGEQKGSADAALLRAPRKPEVAG